MLNEIYGAFVSRNVFDQTIIIKLIVQYGVVHTFLYGFPEEFDSWSAKF